MLASTGLKEMKPESSEAFEGKKDLFVEREFLKLF